MISKPEILIPGGDFNSAIHGLSNGADAVYTGLKSFSARKGAKNLTLDELRRLKTYATENDKKIYIAINTLIEDQEMYQVLSLLEELEKIQVNAIIIQDLGLAKIVKENYNLEIHASTQLAVHNIHGVRALKKLGFTRAVLSRELNLTEIEEIKRAAPDMELEIFIHGALCYGFSGLCLASGKLLGRSANRGECGQICRTWFNNGESKEYNLSLNDLHLGKNIDKLRDIGVESFKIEGRMKGPSYTAKVANYYRSIIEGRPKVESPLVEFNRSGGTGYLFSKTGGTKVNKNFPGHTGLLTGTLLSRSKDSFTINSKERLVNHDGLMLLPETIENKPFKIGVKIIKTKGEKYTLAGSIPKGYKKDIYKISSYNNNLKEFKAESYKPFKTPIDIKVIVKGDGVYINSIYGRFFYSMEIEAARNQSKYREELVRILSPGGSSNYSFNLTEIESVIENPFIPSSILKKVRNQFIEFSIESIEKTSKSRINTILNEVSCIEERSYKPISGEIPFFPYGEKDNRVSLKPVEFNSRLYLETLKSYLKDNSEINLVGLNNIAHLEYIKELPQVNYYCDYGLYTTNRWAKNYLASLIPNLNWVTKWVEKDELTENPPIFISRTCFHKTENGCPDKCGMRYKYNLEQNSRTYKLYIRDCLTYTFV